MLLDKKKKIRPRVSFLRQFFLYPLRPLKNSTRTDMLTIYLTLSWNMFNFKNSSFSKVRYSVNTSPSNSWLKFVFATRVNCLSSFRLSWIYLFFFDDCLSSNIFQLLALTVDLRLSTGSHFLVFVRFYVFFLSPTKCSLPFATRICCRQKDNSHPIHGKVVNKHFPKCIKRFSI